MPTTALKGAHLSFQQDRLWQFQREGSTYCAQCTIFMKGTLNDHVLQQALQQIVEQHTIFQTAFYPLPGMDVPIQVMGHSTEFHCPIISLNKIVEPEQKSLQDILLQSLQKEPFDLAHGPLFRSVVLHLSAETALLYISLPALCSDASTLPLLIANLVKRYNAHLSCQEVAEEPLQYAAVSAWQKQLLLKEEEEAKTARSFWSNFNLSHIKNMHQITKRSKAEKESAAVPKNMHMSLDPSTLFLEVGEANPIHIHALAFFYDVSLQAILLACWLIVLQRLADEPSLVVGVACNGRNDEELAEALGLYTHFVPFSATLENDRTFKQILAFVGPLLEKTMKYQSYFRWPSQPDDNNRSAEQPFFPVTFEHEYWPDFFAAENLSLSLGQRFCYMEPFILKLSVLQIGEHLRLELHYDSHKVTTAYVTRLASMLQMLLHNIVEQPQAAVGTFTLLTASEQNSLLSAFTAPARSHPVQQLHRLFEMHAQRMPNQLAVISTKEQLTYQQLNEQANRLAWVLRKRGIGPNVLVGLCMTRSAQMLVGLLGILKAGGAYLPLDIGSPPARLLYQLQESQTAVLLTQQEMEMHTRLPDWEGTTMCLEELEQEMSQTSADDLPGGSEAEDLAYIIYTSGSTGMPKGVMIRQSSVTNYTLALCEQLRVEPGWHYATVSTLAADLGNTAIFCALAAGGCVQVLDYEMVTSAETMATWAQQHPIDVLKIVPSHLSALLAGEHGKNLLPHQALVLGGEALPTSLLAQIRASGSTCAVYNHYGPTETTIGVLANPLGVLDAQEEEGEKAYGMLPLGKPITNTEVYVLDQLMQIVPVGVTGELYIGGAGLAIGYVQQGERTAERFVPHPYSEHPGARLYRTGDLAWYTEEGKIAFVGRRDTQVKLRGYRIELAEIEEVLKRHPNVRDGAVVTQEDPSGSRYLVGYIAPRKFPVPADMDVQNFLRQHVAEYMVPSIFIYLKFLPLTANGKVDRRQLHTPDTDGNNSLPYLIDVESPERTIILPRDVIELHLVQIWEEILEKRPISVVDDFFQLGGHSLLAVRLMSHISKQFGQNLDLAILFQYPTIAALAVVLRQQVPSDENSVLVPIQPRGTRPPFFCVHPVGGTAFCYSTLARHLGQDQPFYGLQTPIGEALETVEEMAAYYLAAIQTQQPHGPYFLGGWSAGGIIAFEIAQQLQKQGEKVGVLAIIDSNLVPPQAKANVMEEELDLGDTGIVKELLRRFEIILPADFDQRASDEQLSYLTEYAKKTHQIPIDTSLTLVRRYTRIIMLNRHVVHLYDPQDYLCRIDYFASNEALEQVALLHERADSHETAEQHDHMHYWHELAKGGIEVHPIPGDHDKLVEEPHVQILANALKQCIERGDDDTDGLLEDQL